MKGQWQVGRLILVAIFGLCLRGNEIPPTYDTGCVVQFSVTCAECGFPLSGVVFISDVTGLLHARELIRGMYAMVVPCLDPLTITITKNGYITREMVIDLSVRITRQLTLKSISPNGYGTQTVEVVAITDCWQDRDVIISSPDAVGPVTSQRNVYTLHVCSLPVNVTINILAQEMTLSITSERTIVPFVCDFPCGPVPIVEHGTFPPVTSAPIGTVVTYTCDPGYVLEGTSVIACQTDRHWSSEPRCVADCGTIPDVDFAWVTDKSLTTLEGAHVTYNCPASFQMTEKSVVCRNGSWTTLPVCRQQCGPAPLGYYVTFTPPNVTEVGTTVTYTCYPGHNTNDPVETTCSSDGTWSPESGPVCVKTNNSCADGWTRFDDACYKRMKISDSKSAYNDTHCPNAFLGAHVIRPNTEAENTFAKNHLAKFTGPGYFLDATFDATESTWVYRYYDHDIVDMADVELTFFDWAVGKPDGGMNVIFRRDVGLKWDDLSDSVKQHALCEIGAM